MNGNDGTGIDDPLERMARGIAQEVQPERDLWPAIVAAIAAPAAAPPRRWTGWLAQAAAVVLLVGGSSTVTWFAMQDGAAPLSPVSGAGQLVFEPVSGSFGADYSLGPDFTDARNSLLAKLDRQLERLSPETRAEVERNMATIRAAITDINLALAKQPDNALLQELLLSTYSEELSMMKKVDGIAHSVMRREDI